MKRFALLLLATFITFGLRANTLRYTFNSEPLAKALTRLADDHPELNINFIYNELDQYRTTAAIYTDDVYEALRKIIGINPVTLIKRDNTYYIEAMQHGKYRYSGQLVNSEGQPLVGATVLLLAPKDSTVLTYGLTDADGLFRIPCDRKQVIGKMSSLGYKTTTKAFNTFAVGRIVLPEMAIALSDISVEAQNARIYADKSVYLPTSRQKNAARDGNDLLRLMAIPQLIVDAQGGIADNSGLPLSMFINYVPATNQDMSALRTANVVKVEYLEYPTDGRFRGAQRAINFIVQEYEYGGYTKTTVIENFLSQPLFSVAQIYNKFSYIKVTYDLYVGANNSIDTHSGSESQTVYHLTDAQGKPYEQKRVMTTEASRTVSNEYPVTMQATYATDKVQVRNILGATFTANPVNRQSGSLKYTPSLGTDESFATSGSRKSRDLSYTGSYFFALPAQLQLSITPSFAYTHNSRRYNRATGYLDIINNAEEDAYNYRITANLQRRFGQRHFVALSLLNLGIYNRLNYTGNTDSYNKYDIGGSAVTLAYQYQNNGTSVYGDAIWIYEENRICGIRTADRYPAVHLNLRRALSDKQSVTAYYQFASNTPELSMKSPSVLQLSEFVYSSGNPNLKNSRHHTFNVNYTWVPSNTLWLTVYNNSYLQLHRPMSVYLAYKDGQALLQTYSNDGNFFQNNLSLSSTLNLLGGNLQFSINPAYYYYRSTGEYDKSLNTFICNAAVRAYVGPVYLDLSGSTPIRNMYSQSPATQRIRESYGLSAGWGNANWNVYLSVNNIFSRGWETGRTDVVTPLMTNSMVNFGPECRPRIRLDVTYTFDYGKKINRGNEVGAQSGAKSAIMKNQ